MWVTQPVQRTPLWLASWLPTLDKSRGSKSVEFREFGRFMMTGCSTLPGWMLSVLMSLWVQVMSLVAWFVWSSAAEAALADAYQFAGGPVPDRGLVMSGGTDRMRVVRLGGSKVRKARRNAADAHEGGDVFMYRDSSVAPLLDFRRRTKAVMDVLDAMIRDGFSLDEILRVGPVSPVTVEGLRMAWSGALGECRRVAGDVHCRLSDFIHRAVVHRGDEAIRGWRNRLREDPLVTPYKWLRP